MRFCFFILTAVITLGLHAQPIKLKSLSVSDTIVFATLDRSGDLFVITKDGQIQRFGSDGQLKVLYKNKTIPTLFDPRDGGRLFAYYRDQQEYDYLNSSFEITASHRIDSSFVIEPWLICPTADHRLWVLDAADNSLKKVNPRDGVVEVEVMIDSSVIDDATQFKYMREYQGFVFLLNPTKGISIFNAIGHHIRNIQGNKIEHFNFLGEELYYLKGQRVQFFSLFTTETRYIDLKTPRDFILFTGERMIATSGNAIDIYQFKP